MASWIFNMHSFHPCLLWSSAVKALLIFWRAGLLLPLVAVKLHNHNQILSRRSRNYLGTLSWNSPGSWRQEGTQRCQEWTQRWQEGTYLLQTLQEDPKDHGVGQVSHPDGGTLGRHTGAAWRWGQGARGLFLRSPFLCLSATQKGRKKIRVIFTAYSCDLQHNHIWEPS